MSNNKLTESKLYEAISLVEGLLSENQIEIVRSDIKQGGEWLLAFETLCDMLSEEEIPISQGVYELLEEVANLLNVQDKRRLEFLKSQVEE